jgi:hypothetical protein
MNESESRNMWSVWNLATMLLTRSSGQGQSETRVVVDESRDVELAPFSMLLRWLWSQLIYRWTGYAPYVPVSRELLYSSLERVRLLGLAARLPDRVRPAHVGPGDRPPPVRLTTDRRVWLLMIHLREIPVFGQRRGPTGLGAYGRDDGRVIGGSRLLGRAGEGRGCPRWDCWARSDWARWTRLV